jgi:glutaredoxin-like YruB-family protein
MTHKIKVYSTPTCPWCEKVKDFLKDKDVKYTEVNVASDQEAAKEMVEKSGQMGVPVVEIDGKIIIGFDKTALEKSLSKAS